MTSEIKTTSRTVLRRMLRDCDRKLEAWDRTWKRYPGLLHETRYLALDARRREIRRRLKDGMCRLIHMRR